MKIITAGRSRAGLFVHALVAGLLAAGATLADGLPGEYLLTQRWREHLGEYSPLSNPAFLTEQNYIGGRLVFAPVLQGAFMLWEIGATVPLGWHQTVGITALIEGDGDVALSEFSSSGELTSSGTENRNYGTRFFMLSYAVNPWRRLSVGLNVNFGYQRLPGQTLQGLGADLGLAYNVIHHPVAGDHLVGVFLQNLVPPSMTEGTPEFNVDEASNYTGSIKLSWIGRFLERRIDAGFDVYLKDVMWKSSGYSDLGGLTNVPEPTIEWAATARAGVWLFRILQLRGQIGFDDDAIDYWGLAGGVNIPSINAGRDFQMLYQYNLKTEGDAASSHSFYARVDFGKHREEMYAKRLARRMSVAPNELYNKAMTLFKQNMFWDAYFVFSQIETQYPDFFKNDRVSYYRGRCLQMLDMREQAEALYKRTLAQYERSDIVPYAELGLVEVFYRGDRFDELFDYYLKLNKADSPDTLRHHGGYLMGEALLRQGRVRDALAVFDKIPQTHPEYVFALHSGAVASFMVDDYAGGRERLERAITVTPRGGAQTEMVYRSYLLLGYMFYEQQSFAEAITALRLVPATSAHYQEALLGQAWTALRARQWGDCRAIAQLLSRTTVDPSLQEEANLLIAYTHMLQKDFTTALAILDRSSKRLDTLQGPQADEMRIRGEIYDRDRFAYDALATDAVRLSLAQQSAQVQKIVDSMKVTQVEGLKKIDAFYRFGDLFKIRGFYARSLPQVKTDVEYALAVAKTALGRRGITDVQERVRQKQAEIDAEIEKLKREMESLDSKKK